MQQDHGINRSSSKLLADTWAKLANVSTCSNQHHLRLKRWDSAGPGKIVEVELGDISINFILFFSIDMERKMESLNRPISPSPAGLKNAATPDFTNSREHTSVRPLTLCPAPKALTESKKTIAHSVMVTCH